MKIKLTNFFRVLIFFYIIVVFYGFLPIQVANAACSYNVQFSSDKSSVSYSSTVNLTATVSGSGNCGSSVRVAINYYASSVGYSDTATLQNNVGSVVFKVSPQTYKSLISLDPGDFTSGVMTFQVSSPAQSSPLNIDVTSIPATVLPVTVSFSNNSAVFQSGDSTDVTAAVQGNVSSIPSTVTNIYMGVYVNNSSSAIMGFDNITPSNLFASPQTQKGLAINTANGFNGGTSPTPNKVTVKFYQSGTSNEIAEGSSVIQVTGVAPSGTLKPGSVPVGGSCGADNDSSVCVTNLCNGNDVCIKCTSNDICNSAPGETGYTCNLSTGACVAPTAGGGGKLPNNASCAAANLNSSSCQSNYCDGDSLKCEPCTDDAMCNSAGNGFFCQNPGANGVCAASTTPVTGAGNTPGSGNAVNSNLSTNLFNPLPEEDLVHVFLLITQGLLGVLGVLAVTFIVVGGVQMVISAGNEEAITKAKKTITWAIIGLLIALLSFSIIAIVQNLLQADIVSPTSFLSSSAKIIF